MERIACSDQRILNFAFAMLYFMGNTQLPLFYTTNPSFALDTQFIVYETLMPWPSLGSSQQPWP
jgi:hypothetical protein